ncbi:MAG: transposase [Planctomycetes bacterium]|nr:transposase [Planctomycetota bacterium]
MFTRERRATQTLRCPSDLTDDQWAIIEALLPPSGSGGPSGGHPVVVEKREVVNALLYVNRTGCQWRMLPRNFPMWKTVHWYFTRYSADGTWQAIHDQLVPRATVEQGLRKTGAPRRVIHIPQNDRVDATPPRITFPNRLLERSGNEHAVLVEFGSHRPDAVVWNGPAVTLSPQGFYRAPALGRLDPTAKGVMGPAGVIEVNVVQEVPGVHVSQHAFEVLLVGQVV